jgi:D-lactate dehydrogenase
MRLPLSSRSPCAGRRFRRGGCAGAKRNGALSETPPSRPIEFSADPYLIEKYWKICKGLFPAVGAVRPVGTTVIIEDVAVPIDKLAAATADLQAALRKHGYPEAIIFGHALDGNLHFVFAQGFADDEAIRRYAALMDEVADIINKRYDGSLKAEHGPAVTWRRSSRSSGAAGPLS